MPYQIRELLFVENDDGIELWLQIDEKSWLSELSDDLGGESKGERDNRFNKLETWIHDMYPYVKINTVKILVGSLVIGTLALPMTGVTRVHAYTIPSSATVQNTHIVFNGKPLIVDQNPIHISGRVIIPVRAIAEAFGANVQWDGVKREVTIIQGDTNIKLKIDSSVATVNGKEVKLDAAAQIINQRTFAPVRFIAETFGAKVSWEPKTRTVFIEQQTMAYTVQSGDSLWKLAQRFNTTVANLMVLNQLSSEEIRVGQVLHIRPSGENRPGVGIERRFEETHGYTVINYYGDTSSLSSLRQNAQRLTSIATFSHQLNEDGTLFTHGVPTTTIDYANSAGLSVYMLIHNFTDVGFSKVLLHNVLSDQQKRAILIDETVKEAKRYGYSGVEIDFEGIAYSDRATFTQFITELKEKLEKENLSLMVTVPAKTWDDPKNAWSGGYDFKAIGELADRVMIMSYDEHWSGGDPGPIASYPWFEKVVAYGTQAIPKEKVLFGIAAYAYDWKIGKNEAAKGLSAQGVTNLIKKYGGSAKWDPVSKSPYYEYKDNEGISHIVWFEDELSLKLKTDLAAKHGAAGVGIWRLGLEGEHVWQVLHQNVKSPHST